MTRPYWSERQGRGPVRGPYDLPTALELFGVVVDDLRSRDFFVEWFGFECTDTGEIPGRAGIDIDNHIYLAIHRHEIWPPSRHAVARGANDDTVPHSQRTWDEDTFFDAIEFLHDRVSEPVDGRMHGWMGCGMHWETFSAERGRETYRSAVDPILRRYSGGFALNENGELVRTAPEGLEELYQSEVADLTDDELLRTRYADAMHKYRNRHSSQSDRRDAVRDLADVLELIRPSVKEHMIRGDEGALFTIANNYGIRHLNTRQSVDWDNEVWLEWMFVTYLAAIQLVLRLLSREDGKGQDAPAD